MVLVTSMEGKNSDPWRVITKFPALIQSPVHRLRKARAPTGPQHYPNCI